jgi:hypothetical protein
MMQAPNVATIDRRRAWTTPLRLPSNLATDRKEELFGELNVGCRMGARRRPSADPRRRQAM